MPEYYLLRQDNRYTDAPRVNFIRSKYQRSDFIPEKARMIPERNVVFYDSKAKSQYIDFLSFPTFLMSNKMMKVVSMYDRTLQYKKFCILNNRQNQYANYYAPLLQPESKLTDGAITKLKVSQNEELAVRLDLLESLLRREVTGILIQKYM